MTPHSKQTHREGPSGIRLSVWLLAFGSLLVILLAVRLTRLAATKPPPQSTQTVGDPASSDAAPVVPRSPRSAGDRAVPRTEPRQKTLSDWVLDLEGPMRGIAPVETQQLATLGRVAPPQYQT